MRSILAPSCLLVIAALAGVCAATEIPLVLTSPPDGDWPTHAAIELPQGAVNDVSLLQLSRDGKPLAADAVALNHWPDGSLRRVHVHGLYRGGEVLNYDGAGTVNPAAAQALTVTDTAAGIRVDTGAGVLEIARPFLGVRLQDSNRVVYSSQFDGRQTVEVEEQGRAHIVLRLEGVYRSRGDAAPPFVRYLVRFILQAGSPLVRVDYASTFMADMRKHQIRQMGLAVPKGVILDRDHGKKRPMRPQSMGGVYWHWPPDVATARNKARDVLPENVYKFACFTQGPTLDLRVPDSYYDVLSAQKETTELKAEYARTASFEGASMFARFALVLGDPGAEEVERLRRVWEADPIALPKPAPTGPWSAADDTARRGMLGYAHSVDRYQDHGWHIYGDTHHQERIDLVRPSLHRVNSNNHYNHIATAWQLMAASADPNLLHFARIATDHLDSIGMIRHESSPGKPAVLQHHPGAFWHCKSFLVPSGRDYGMDRNDSDAALLGHFVHPSALVWAWYFDADRWARDGYEIWVSHVGYRSVGAAREANVNLVEAITSHEYRPSEKTADAIARMADVLFSRPLLTQNPGPLFEPTWLNRYAAFRPDDERLKPFVLAAVEAIGKTRAPNDALGLIALAADLSGDARYLDKGAGMIERAQRGLIEDPSGSWQDFGQSPGLTDFGFQATWLYFKASLERAGKTSLPPIDEPGTYWIGVVRFDRADEWRARATRILIDKADDSPLELSINAIGALDAAALEVLGPDGKRLYHVARLEIGNGQDAKDYWVRESSLGAARERHTVAGPAGRYEVRIPGNLAICQPISQWPEWQVLSRQNRSDWRESCEYRISNTKGVLRKTVQRPVSIKFTARGQTQGTHVICGKTDRWLTFGQSVTVELAEETPLDVFSNYTGFVSAEIDVKGDGPGTDEPLVFRAR